MRLTKAQFDVIQNRLKGGKKGKEARIRAALDPDIGKISYERVLFHQIVEAGLPEPTREHRFWPERKFRFDLAYPDRKIAIEIDSMVHRTKGRFVSDVVKYREAAIQGWCVLRFLPKEVRSGAALDDIKRVVAASR